MRIKLKDWKREISIVVILLSLSILSACGEQQQKTPKIEVKPTKVIKIKDPIKLQQQGFPATVIKSRQAVITIELSGTIIRLPIIKGQKVNKGELLLELDAQSFINAVQQAQTNYNQAQTEYQRATKLFKENHISRSDFDKKEAKATAAKAKLEDAKYNLSNTKIIAPFAGTISEIYVGTNEYVKAHQDLLLIQDLKDISLSINLPENIMTSLTKSIQENQADPRVIFDSIPDKIFYAKYKEHSPQINPKTQTYNIVFTMPRPNSYDILPGMSATILVMLPPLQNNSDSFIEIPSSAVFYDKNNQAAVWVVQNDSTIIRQNITVGKIHEDKIQVIAGLQPKQVIVSSGVDFLQAGDKVLEVY